jgi:transposase-like protein
VRKKHYQYTAIDDCTHLRVLRIYERLDQKTAIKFVDYVLEQLPFQVMKIQTDNGAEFQAGFHWHLPDKGIQHAYIRPSTPRLMEGSSGPTASMTKSSTACSPVRSSTTPSSSTPSSTTGSASTISHDRTEL